MAANYIFLYPPLINGNAWFNGYTTPVNFNGGTFVVTVDSTSSIDPLSGERRLTLRSTATYRDSTASVLVILRPSNFSKFASMQVRRRRRSTGRPMIRSLVHAMSRVN